tara:strand:- start:2892 stop:5252 length:2361 start_codon:yes stop_codon:yes gene_type:complete
MINKFNIFFFILFFLHSTLSSSEEFNFSAKEIEVLDNGEQINAYGNVQIKMKDGLIINSDNAKIDKINNSVSASGNVYLKDDLKEIEIFSNSVFFDKTKNVIKIIEKSETRLKNSFFLNSKNLVYERSNKTIKSNFDGTLKDKFNNIMTFKKFNLNLEKNILDVRELSIKDNENNNFKLNQAFVNLNSKEVIGDNAKLFFNKKIFGNSENDPRIYGNSLFDSKDETVVTKGVFTSCKLVEDECSPWLIKAEQITHNKIKKTIEYKNAWLEIYDKPVVYFPFFYHPDPTVKRQSGFLMPKINSSNSLGSSIQIPYYNVVAENKDFTLSPRIFFDDKFMLQSEYRQVNKFTKSIYDHSFVRDDDNTKSHFFGNIYSLKNDNKIELNIETTSNKDYLQKYNVNSELVKNDSLLNSYLTYEKNNDDYYFISSLEVFEDLTENDSDSYEYIYPNYKFGKNFDTKIGGKFEFYSSGYQKKYETNRYDGLIVNDLRYVSEIFMKDEGVINNFALVLKNVNSEGENSTELKENTDNKVLSSFVHNTKYPLIKKTDNYTNYLTPILSTRLSLSETKNVSSEDQRITFGEIFNIDRLNDDYMIEGGESLTIGTEYSLFNENNFNILNLSAAQVLRLQENPDLPIDSTIGEKRSDFIGSLELNPSEKTNINYSYSLDNNLDDLNYNYITANYSVNNFITSFKFLEDNSSSGDKSFIENNTKISFKNNYSLQFNTNKNLEKNMTEYYNLLYEYKNDCLSAAINYRKSFYKDTNITPEENIFFTIKIIPFGNVNSPSIN